MTSTIERTDTPVSPITYWGEAQLKRSFGRLYHNHTTGGRGGWRNEIVLNVLEDELVSRGISPVEVVSNR